MTRGTAIALIILIVIASIGWIGWFLWMSTSTLMSAKIRELKSEIESLHSLKADYESLRNRYIALELKLRSVEDIIHLRKSEVLAKDKAIAIPGRHEAFIEYETSYAGYIEVSFTSSQPVSFIFNNPTLGDYAYYPILHAVIIISRPITIPISHTAENATSEGYRSGEYVAMPISHSTEIKLGAEKSGEFRIPVIPPYTAIYIINQNEATTNVTITVTYRY